jgi:hypothetical protein
MWRSFASFELAGYLCYRVDHRFDGAIRREHRQIPIFKFRQTRSRKKV